MTAFLGSQNLIDSTYLMPRNVAAGRHWHDVMIELTGQIVAELESVFAVDWYTETGELLDAARHHKPAPAVSVGGVGGGVAGLAMPSRWFRPARGSGPSRTRGCSRLIHLAQRRVTI